MGRESRSTGVSGEIWEIMGNPDIESGNAEVSLGFMGNHPLRLDSAQRVAVPAKFRETLDRMYGDTASHVVLLPDDGKVKVLPMPVWEKLKKQLEELSDFDPASDDLRTYMFGNMMVCALDAQNRIRLTPGMCDMAGLQKEVVVVGKQDRMEIWDAARWKEFNISTSRNLRDVMGQVFRNRQAGPAQ